MHTSIKLDNPAEIINIVPLNPLISKCQIKVCWVGEQPNRNRSIITKETARQIANSLPGSPIVGYYNEGKEDYEEHNRMIDISNGKFEIKDTTKPIGFVDLGAKVWFQKFLDDGRFEREYMMTEGFLWTGQYPEAQRIIDKGNNQSMELDENTLNAAWTKDSNGKPEFFIINDALISKLCVLGEDVEPCFEGASITAPIIQFSLDDGFREQLFSMMQELKDLLSEGGTKVFTRYAVEIGDALWTALYSHIDEKYSNENGLMYSIKGVYEEGDQKFAVLSADDNYFRLNFSFSENNEFEASDDLVSLDSYTPDSEPQFAEEAVAEYAKKKKEEKEEEEKKSAEKEDKSNSEDNDKNDNNSEGKTEDDEEEEEKKKKKNKFAEDKKCPKCGKPVDECECEDEDEDKKKKFSLEDIPEYVELQSKYSELETKYNNLVTEKENLESQLAPLAEFKAAAVRKEKENMISSFTMLSEEDKQDVLTNIDTYSLDEIEGKLSIICVRNRVNFSLDEDKTPDGITTFNLEGGEDLSTPAWVKAAMAVAKNMN